MFSKILIANRGEIALRIIRACKEMEIKTVAVYSEPDIDSLHVRAADEAICIGPAPSADSYLNIPSIISAAEITDVEAIHPGYGFLAENAHFAEICQSCKIKFIGPNPEVMRLMGDKIQAKQEMRKAGVPIIPGSTEVVKTQNEALKIAQKIGYPIIIKAAAGGGGKGMRIAHNDISLVNAFMTAQTEAEKSFKDGSLYIEKFVDEARHIEIQIMADNYGHILHLGERDCTIQRRYQKLIEESPSPALDNKLRKRIGETAVKVAKAVNYSNLGTIEFLLTKDKQFYFVEMNTRLQVEHPVTEMCTGIDLVKHQIALAAEERLKFGQDHIRFNGHSIECRINAEDPENNFLPSPGRIELYSAPGGPGVRLDSHVYQGYLVPPFYDSLIAKLIVFGERRDLAIKIMQRALEEYMIEPIKTTIPFYKKVLNNPEFLRGQVYTNFVEKLLGEKLS